MHEKMMLNNVVLIDEDYEDALHNLNNHIGNKKIGLYFIDGPHDYRSQLMCLMLATPYLHENAIIVIDDANYQHVRQANCDFLTTHTEFKLLFEAHTDCHPGNMTLEQIKDAKVGWWDGVNILVRDKSDLLKRTFPSTERNRLLFENDHVVHASEVSELVPDMIRSIQLMSITKPIQSIRSILSIMKKLYSHRRSHKNRFHFMNTYSDILASSKYAEWNTGSNVSSAT